MKMELIEILILIGIPFYYIGMVLLGMFIQRKLKIL